MATSLVICSLDVIGLKLRVEQYVLTSFCIMYLIIQQSPLGVPVQLSSIFHVLVLVEENGPYEELHFPQPCFFVEISPQYYPSKGYPKMFHFSRILSQVTTKI